jgi:hypothetical protein
MNNSSLPCPAENTCCREPISARCSASAVPITVARRGQLSNCCRPPSLVLLPRCECACVVTLPSGNGLPIKVVCGSPWGSPSINPLPLAFPDLSVPASPSSHRLASLRAPVSRLPKILEVARTLSTVRLVVRRLARPSRPRSNHPICQFTIAIWAAPHSCVASWP